MVMGIFVFVFSITILIRFDCVCVDFNIYANQYHSLYLVSVKTEIIETMKRESKSQKDRSQSKSYEAQSAHIVTK